MNEPLSDNAPQPMSDEDRYSRLRLIGWWKQSVLKEAKVLVVGAGALGNEVLKNLALVGVGEIILVDFDRIELSNLSRSVLFRAEDKGKSKAQVAADAVRSLNPEVKVTPLEANIMTDVGLGVFAEVGVVIGCLDNREARLWVNRSCWKTTTPWIDGAIQEINGVFKVYLPPDGTCYECTMTENDYRLINLRYSCPQLREEEISAGKVPTAPTIASIVAGWQTQEALKILHDLPVTGGVATVFNGLSNQTYQTKLPRKEDCLSHETYPIPHATGLRVSEATANELFQKAKPLFKSEAKPLTLHLERDLVSSFRCHECGNQIEVLKPTLAVYRKDAKCSECGHPEMEPIILHSLDSEDALAKKKLSDLGIAPFDWIRITSEEEEQFLSLDGDKNHFFDCADED
ncbi:Dinucleotide-utilizing enzyme [Planctomycetales bacterium 10988]|nr:Dinucleotide-utilizing enzyme [Planctomycetales bacterium 10988]